MARAQRPGNAAQAKDRRIVLWLCAGVLAAILLFSIFGPAQDDNDPSPTTFNSGSRGIKAAYLLMAELGYNAQRWSLPATRLQDLDAAKTTLILTQPNVPYKENEAIRAAIAAFLERGGRVLATGAGGAGVLPGGNVAEPARIYKALCYTSPDGNGELARAGQLSIADPVRWSASGPQYKVEQRCGADAVVVDYKVGAGEAVWWSSPMPLSNSGLSENNSLKLVLASLGPPGRTLLFDEYMHEEHESMFATVHGLPWWPLAWQSAAVAVLLVLSRGRRNGPLRSPAHLPRTSPVEFAESMGRLYERAHATQAATGAARDRLMEFLRDHCGLSREVLRCTPEVIAEGLRARFGGDWRRLQEHLEQAAHAESGIPKVKDALELVRALEADRDGLERTIQGGKVKSLAARQPQQMYRKMRPRERATD